MKSIILIIFLLFSLSMPAYADPSPNSVGESVTQGAKEIKVSGSAIILLMSFILSLWILFYLYKKVAQIFYGKGHRIGLQAGIMSNWGNLTHPSMRLESQNFYFKRKSGYDEKEEIAKYPTPKITTQDKKTRLLGLVASSGYGMGKSLISATYNKIKPTSTKFIRPLLPKDYVSPIEQFGSIESTAQPKNRVSELIAVPLKKSKPGFVGPVLPRGYVPPVTVSSNWRGWNDKMESQGLDLPAFQRKNTNLDTDSQVKTKSQLSSGSIVKGITRSGRKKTRKVK